jgi:hypothetical protein
VKGHDPAHTGLHGGAEGHELDAVEPRGRTGDARELEMRVLLGVAVSGKVLARSEHPVLLDAAHEGGAELRDELRILAEGPEADDRILRVVVDVEHRRERHVDAECAPFERRGATHLVRERRVASWRRSPSGRGSR